LLFFIHANPHNKPTMNDPVGGAQHRAVFDFQIELTNGGALNGTGFRLDVPREAISTDELGQLLVRRLGPLFPVRAYGVVA